MNSVGFIRSFTFCLPPPPSFAVLHLSIGHSGHRRPRRTPCEISCHYMTLFRCYLPLSYRRMPTSFPKSFVYEVTETDLPATRPGTIVSGKQTTIYPKESSPPSGGCTSSRKHVQNLTTLIHVVPVGPSRVILASSRRRCVGCKEFVIREVTTIPECLFSCD